MDMTDAGLVVSVVDMTDAGRVISVADRTDVVPMLTRQCSNVFDSMLFDSMLL